MRLARIASRKKHPAKWVDLEDVASELRLLLWQYMFERAATAEFKNSKCTCCQHNLAAHRDDKKRKATTCPEFQGERFEGFEVVGFSFEGANSPGVWLRWKVTHHLAKTLSKQRGECQHCRGLDSVSCKTCVIDKAPEKKGVGPKNRMQAPEYLSKTGKVPDQGEDSPAIAQVEARRALDKVHALCKTAREFAIVQALSRGLGDDRRVVAYLIETTIRSSRSARWTRSSRTS